MNTMSKALVFFKSFWANAAGAWWSDRPLWLILPSLIIIVPFITFLFNKTFFNSSIKEYVLLIAGLIYAAVLFIWRDVTTLQGDILPLVSLFLIMTVIGIETLLKEINSKLSYYVLALGILLYAMNTLSLVKEHKEGTALVQLIKELTSDSYLPLVVESETMNACIASLVKPTASQKKFLQQSRK